MIAGLGTIIPPCVSFNVFPNSSVDVGVGSSPLWPCVCVRLMLLMVSGHAVGGTISGLRQTSVRKYQRKGTETLSLAENKVFSLLVTFPLLHSCTPLHKNSFISKFTCLFCAVCVWFSTPLQAGVTSNHWYIQHGAHWTWSSITLMIYVLTYLFYTLMTWNVIKPFPSVHYWGCACFTLSTDIS